MLAAEAGASLADQMKRLRHSTHGAALRYQHAVDGRDAELAERMSLLAEPWGPAPGIASPDVPKRAAA